MPRECVMEDRPMLSCLKPWDFPKGREKSLFGGTFKVFVLDVFPRPCFQVGAEVEWVSELAKNRGLDSVTSKGPHQQRTWKRRIHTGKRYRRQ